MFRREIGNCDEEEDDLPSDLLRLVENEEKQILPYKEDLEVLNLGTEEERREVKIDTTITAKTRQNLIKLLQDYHDVFAWSYQDMPGLDTDIIRDEVRKQLDAGFLQVAKYPEWKKKQGQDTPYQKKCRGKTPHDERRNRGKTPHTRGSNRCKTHHVAKRARHPLSRSVRRKTPYIASGTRHPTSTAEETLGRRHPILFQGQDIMIICSRSHRHKMPYVASIGVIGGRHPMSLQGQDTPTNCRTSNRRKTPYIALGTRHPVVSAKEASGGRHPTTLQGQDVPHPLQKKP
ncbi:hypothetical protein GQ457_11G025500 [Hibiscus cannabinus]